MPRIVTQVDTGWRLAENQWRGAKHGVHCIFLLDTPFSRFSSEHRPPITPVAVAGSASGSHLDTEQRLLQ